MKRNKFGFAAILAVSMIASLLAGCAGQPQQALETGSPSDTSASAANSGEKTTIQFWHSLGGTNGEYIDAMIKRFNESQDEVEVVGTYQGGYDETVTKLQQAIASNTGPDVSMLERAYVEMFADAEVLEDLTPYFADSGLSKDSFTPGLMGHSVFHDKLVSLPLNRSTPILHINKTLLDEKGMAVPTTWEELKAVGEALAVKEGDTYTRYGITMPYDTWYPIAMISQSGGKFFNEEGTSVDFVDNGIGLEVFQFMKDMQSTGALYYPPAQDSGNITTQMFVEGKVGILYGSTGSIGKLASTVDFEYVTAFLPKNDVFATPTGGANVSILASSPNKEAAWKFVHWMMTDSQGALSFILDSGYLPFTKEMVESKEMQELWAKEPIRKVAYDQLQYAVDTNKHVAWPEVMHEFFSAIEAIMYDSQDIQATLDTFKQDAERILAE